MDKKVILAFGISIFAGFGYLGYLYIRRRSNNQFIQETLQKANGIEVVNVAKLMDGLAETSGQLVELVRRELEERIENPPQPGSRSTLQDQIEDHKDYGKVKQFLELTVFNPNLM